jgi:hypothetical protein
VKLINAGFKPEEALKAMGMTEIQHTGVPSNTLQPVASIDPNDPSSVYEVN